MSTSGLGLRIRQLRESVDLTQKQLADKLAIQRTALVQIEAGSRKLSAEEVLAAARLFNVTVEQLMDLNQKPEMTLCEAAQPGFTGVRASTLIKNMAKFKEVLLYILEAVGARPHVGETVIFKLLYFADFDFYEKYEEQLTGACYIRNHHGPAPSNFSRTVRQMIDSGDLEKVKSEFFTYPNTKYFPRRPADLGLLSGRELKTINDVLSRLGGMNEKQIAEYSKGDVPWAVTGPGKQIPYETVFYRLPPYSLRKHVEE